MARSRNIKPGFFKNELLVALPFEYRLLFIGLWTIADREGRLEDRPTKIKMELFPADAVDVAAALQALHEHEFILRYEADGKRYIQVLAWHKHQNPHQKEALSVIPAPANTQTSTGPAPDKHRASTRQAEKCPERAGLIPDSLIPDSLSPLPPTGEPPAAGRIPDGGKLWPPGWSDEAEAHLQELLEPKGYPHKRPDGTRMSNGTPKELRRLWLAIIRANPGVTPRLLKNCAWALLEELGDDSPFLPLLSTVYGPKKATWEAYRQAAEERIRGQDAGSPPAAEPIPFLLAGSQ